MHSDLAQCAQGSGEWLPLIEFSVKSGLSLSTIRRKIKSNSLPYRLEKGRYLILYPAMKTNAQENISPLSDLSRWQDQPLSEVRGQLKSTPTVKAAPAVEGKPVVTDAVQMLSDAFEYALLEKEGRIRLLERANRNLEERVSELKLLLRVLEEKFKIRY